MSYFHSLILIICFSAQSSFAQGIWTDAQGDAVIRRTDIGNDAPLPAGFEPIDLLSVSLNGWMPVSPSTDLYIGSIIQGDADFVRVQIIVDGLVCPPGPIGLGGFPYNPFQFGDRPITGFIELDIDDEKNSGGELMPMAQSRYLANVGRFGMSPDGSISERMIQSGSDFDSDFFTGPIFEQTGSEFTLIMCGCFAPTVVIQNGNMDSIFDWGETWVVQGRFFERFESFRPESFLFGGSDFGLFDPTTTLQFVHDPISDQTMITLVYQITNAGAALAANEPEQPIDLETSLNHTSIEEALDDLIIGANFTSGSLGVLTEDWQGNDLSDYREPSKWSVTALIGTAPTTPQPSSFYIWTDTGFNESYADFDFDDHLTNDDIQVIQDYIDDNDGTSIDDDSTINDQVGIPFFASEFHFYDLNYDGIVSVADFPTLQCTVDFTGDGVLDFFDISAFLIAFSSQDSQADLTNDNNWDFFDISAFLTLFSQGCP